MDILGKFGKSWDGAHFDNQVELAQAHSRQLCRWEFVGRSLFYCVPDWLSLMQSLLPARNFLCSGHKIEGCATKKQACQLTLETGHQTGHCIRGTALPSFSFFALQFISCHCGCLEYLEMKQT